MRALTSWQPLGQLSTVHHEIDDLFSKFFGEEGFGHGYTAMPAIESFTRNDELVVRADLPGIDPKDVEISVEGNQLTIGGERKSEHNEGEGERTYREVQYGRFERLMSLPSGVDPDSVKASYHNGVLEVTMKAPKGYTSKKVPISMH